MSLLLADDITVAGEAVDGEEGLRVCAEVHPDVVLMDLDMPHLDGFSATRALCDRIPAPRVIILSMYLDDELIREALDAGAIGYLEKSKSLGTEDLIRAIRAAHAGQVGPTTPALRTCGTTGRGTTGRLAPAPGRLTKREREVLALVAAGWRNQEIAERLGITPATVSFHIRRSCARLGVAARAELVARATRLGELGDGEQERS